MNKFLTIILAFLSVPLYLYFRGKSPERNQEVVYQQQVVQIESSQQKAKQDLNQFLNTLTPELKDEIKIYREKISKLRSQGKDLYEGLSDSAKKAMRIERDFRKIISNSNE